MVDFGLYYAEGCVHIETILLSNVFVLEASNIFVFEALNYY